jgi:hypothetical protein
MVMVSDSNKKWRYILSVVYLVYVGSFLWDLVFSHVSIQNIIAAGMFSIFVIWQWRQLKPPNESGCSGNGGEGGDGGGGGGD